MRIGWSNDFHTGKRQEPFDIEYSELCRLLSAVSQSDGQSTVNSLIGFQLKQIEKEENLSTKHLLYLTFYCRNPCRWWQLNPYVFEHPNRKRCPTSMLDLRPAPALERCRPHRQVSLVDENIRNGLTSVFPVSSKQ
jgi:hypothetical protein